MMGANAAVVGILVAALADPPEYDDDAIIGHHSWSYLKAALAWVEDRPGPSASHPGEWLH